MSSWLQADLAATTLPTIVFCPRRLGGEGILSHNVDNASVVRGILEASGVVEAVFANHSHINDRTVVNDITYYTMMVMTYSPAPDNAYAVITVKLEGAISILGFGQQYSYGCIGQADCAAAVLVW